MNLDQLIRSAKPYFEPAIDQGEMRERTIRALSEVSRKTTRRSSLGKKMIIAIAISLVLVPATVGFAYYKMVWSNASVYTSNENIDPSKTITPLDRFDDILNTARKTKTLSESRLIANFPIRVPEKIEGWNRNQSIGVIGTMETQVGSSIYKKGQNVATTEGGTTTVSDAPLVYYDLYTNEKDQKVVVSQSYDLLLSESLQGKISLQQGYPKDSTILQGFGDDLVVLSDLQNGRKYIALYHKEADAKVTRIDIWGNTATLVLESFTHAYLQAASK
jgi:hypothetical protein